MCVCVCVFYIAPILHLSPASEELCTSLITLINSDSPLSESVRILCYKEGSRDTEDWSNDAGNSSLTSQQEIIFQNIFK